MNRVIVDYNKLTPEILTLLTNKFPDGYGDNDIITFSNHRNERIEAVEVSSLDTIYLVKISSKLQYTMINFDQDADEIIEEANINEDEIVTDIDLDD